MRKILWSAGDHREHAAIATLTSSHEMPPHVACARWLLQVRTLELQRDVARRFIQWAVILRRAQIVEQTNRGQSTAKPRCMIPVSVVSNNFARQSSAAVSTSVVLPVD